MLIIVEHLRQFIPINLRIFLCLLLSMATHIAYSQKSIIVNNLKPRLDTDGNIIDAHDGRVARFGGKFYMYGTSYGNTSGYVRSNFFQSYSSDDLMTWKKQSPLLINPPSGIYYRPHVIYNQKTKKYILWYNWYSKLWEGKFGVATADNPTGPFKIVNNDVKVFHSDKGVGDFGIFIDDDQIAYIAYNTISGHKGSVEKLSDNYLSSTMENGGFITDECEAGAIFKKSDTYYLLTDFTCCFCTQGSGVRVYTSKHPTKGYQLQNNINRYPGKLSAALTDKNLNPNQYAILNRQKDTSFASIQIDLPASEKMDHIKVYQFTGNRYGVCGDTLAKKVHDLIKPIEFEVFIKDKKEWIKLPVQQNVATTSIHNIVTLSFASAQTKSILLKPVSKYPYKSIYINEIEIYHGTDKKYDQKELNAYILDGNPLLSPPIIPAQQTFVMPLKTQNGTQHIWMGDLWGSASDNIKGHDYQYWGAPLIFDENGDIKPMEWVDEWKAVLVD